MEIATGAMSTLLPKLADLIKDEYKLQKSVRGEIMFLKAELESMEAALLKVSEAPIDQPPDIQVKLWAREVRELSYDVEDRIDAFMVRIESRVPGKTQSFMGFIDRCLNLLTTAKIRHNIGADIRRIKARISEVSERRHRYKLDVPAKPTGPTVDSLRLSALYKKATELVGIEEKSNGIIKRLMEGDEASKKQLKIVSLVGSGGLGKTTLANVVYEKLKEQFDCGALVSVSLNPNMVNIFNNMLHQLDGDKYRKINEATWGEAQLINELRNFLRYKRYFIVIDDIWNTSEWETIQYALTDNECGSRIIATTRSFDVANQVGGIYRVEPLSDIDSRKLFYQRIFGTEDKCHHHLAEVSEKILKKCGGVPLAIITIASLLANKNGKENAYNYWSKVYQSMGSGLEDSPNVKNMRRILAVSYYDLHPHLKTCLLYLSLFPEDHEIETKHLIRKWIGEGFVSKEQGKSLYEVGEGYVDELINRSMIQPETIGHDSKTVSFRVHDVVLDLINFLSNEENFLTTIGGQQTVSLPNKIRRLSLQSSKEEDLRQLTTMSLSHVRSLGVFKESFNLVPALSTFTVLRVLDLSGCEQVKNHHFKDFCNLFHLRYLSLRQTSITEVPKEIQNLQFLQVLDLSETSSEKMPSTFIHLTQLLHLRVAYIRLPDGFGNLKSLQEVEGFITVESPSMLHDLGRLTELRALGIKFCEWNESYEKPFIECLSNMVSLKSLKTEGHIGSLDSGCDKLSPGPQQLCSVDMYLTSIPAVPRWMSSLCSLSSLKIGLLTLGELDLQVLGSIPSLTDLQITVMKPTQERDERLVIGNNYLFQCLTRLKIYCYRGSMEVMFAPGAMQNLKTLHLVFWLGQTMHQFGDVKLGLEHLVSLERAYVDMKDDGTTPKEMKAAEHAIQKAVEMNPNKPRLELKWVHKIQKGIRVALYVQKSASTFSVRSRDENSL
ncbi:disease resistance protein RGA5-like [Phragmites australis]|uniref:disease resistance protein RGA5-like n=1 Tax=Phragmites australis TaxID=29695 RepID=UPI002D784152|nr:disease resistance protein RGA5-like [Phragmites australis]XP_062182663.1 disease resistance protein RGA5-like [Phragmites australis]XP_062182664.1 disease resistance protein RGA5-like [Phragmites australis]XP_062182666.1 disease resistance protein RGA5-like [Phragmites australis]